MERFWTPDELVLLISSTPTSVATFPVPSALKIPPTDTGPMASNPRSAKVYCPLRSDSLPEPQGIAAETVSVKLWFAPAPIPLSAVMVIGYEPAVPVAGIPLMVAVPS